MGVVGERAGHTVSSSAAMTRSARTTRRRRRESPSDSRGAVRPSRTGGGGTSVDGAAAMCLLRPSPPDSDLLARRRRDNGRDGDPGRSSCPDRLRTAQGAASRAQTCTWHGWCVVVCTAAREWWRADDLQPSRDDRDQVAGRTSA
jgi:hypothetical protein